MPEITKNPFMTFFDKEFMSYAGVDIMSRTLIVFVAIMCALRFFDMITDATTKPSKQHIITRGVIAFTVPFLFIFMSTYMNTLPSEYRTYGAGTYEVGKTLPAGSYFLYASDSGASVTIDGEDGEVSHEWRSGNLGTTIYEGDTITFEGCFARNRTMGLVYNANAATKHIAIGTTCLVGGVDLKPGTYELDSMGEESAYEVRDAYLESGNPISAEEFGGVAYADVHYGDVLYIEGATVSLYSDVFSLPRPDKDAKTDADSDGTATADEEKDTEADGKTEADGGDAKTDAEKADGEATGTDAKANGTAEDAKDADTKTDAEKAAEPTSKVSEGESTEVGNISSKASDIVQTEKPLTGETGGDGSTDMSLDFNGDGQVTEADFLQRISVVPWTVPSSRTISASPTFPTTDGDSEKTDGSEKDDGKKNGEDGEWSFHDAIQSLAKEAPKAAA